MNLLALLLLAAPSPAGVWSRYGGPAGDFLAPATAPQSAAVEWRRPFGTGTSGVVTDGVRLYTMYATPNDRDRAAQEFAVALDPQTGKTLWEVGVPVAPREKQETFGGAPVRPQSTPVVHDGRLFTLGFAGRLAARDAATGRELWSWDLVRDHQATPVQYGFAASPIVHAGKLIVHAGGKHALIAFEPATGAVVWASAGAEPSYATPVVMDWNGRAMLVQLTRDALFGLDPADGRTLWTYPLPDKNFTNVPTPIALPGGQLLLSGQGADGTRLLQLAESAGIITAKDVWHQKKVQYFYTNWASDGGRVFGFPGNGGKRFTSLRVADGSVESQGVGQTDANALRLGNKLLLLRGDGLLSLGTLAGDGFEAEGGAKPVAGRCWAAPTPLGNSVIVRSDTELAAVPLASLRGDFRAPADSGVSALDAAYGGSRPPAK